MVHRRQAAFAVVFEHREVDHPQRRPFALVSQTQVFTQLQTQRAQRVGHYFLVVGAEEDHVSILRAGAVKDRFHDFSGQEFGHRAVDPVHAFGTLGHFNIGQPFRAVDLHKVAVFVNQLAGQRGPARDAQGRHAPFRIVGRAGKDREFHRLQQVGDVHQLHRVTQIRFIGAIATFGFGEGHDRELAQVDAFHFQPQLTHHRLHDLTHLRRGHKGGFHVDLGEFRLTVGTQVFIAEAFDDLIVAVEAGHHQQLFEQLRRLRQRVEFAFVHAGRHEVIAGAFRGGFSQHRGFDVEEAMVVHKAAHKAGNFRAGFQALRHLRTTQVEVAVFQTRFFGVDVIGVQRQRF